MYIYRVVCDKTFQVGDIISVIDMPPVCESSWLQGKRVFEVGFSIFVFSQFKLLVLIIYMCTV